MSGLDLLARKSLERGSDTSIFLSASGLSNKNDVGQSNERWSWESLKEQFCVKNAECLFEKYQSRLHHTMLILSLVANTVAGATAIFIWCLFSDVSSTNFQLSMSLRIVSVISCFLLFIISCRQQWFYGSRIRLMVSSFLLVLIAMTETATSIKNVASGLVVGPRFIFSPIFGAAVFLPFPRWYQVVIATFSVCILEMTVSGLSYKNEGVIPWRRMSADLLFYTGFSILGMFIRFLIEFNNRKAFLDRRDCFESKFHLQYEKNQEEHLLLSVLPNHISEQVREGIRNVMRSLHLSAPLPQRPFTELFVEKHTEVSILYADIVNSVALTASLNVSDLVETLNELFGRFDDCAEKNACLRIKLLGDCYYCVSGLPEKDPLHADHCVRMGLDMIEIIRTFREETRMNVDMRIGVHSGNVLSGLLGLRKWQFDIWSRDVNIASRMEQSGRPGCVHITRATKDLLSGDYTFEPGNGNIRDDYLNRLDMETFFITPRKKQAKRDSLYVSANPDRSPVCSRRNASFNHAKAQRKLSSATEVLSSRRRTVLGFSLLQFRLMVSQVNEFMESAIDAMALSVKDQWFSPDGIKPLLLLFQDKSVEIPFLLRNDPLFGYSLIGNCLCNFILICVEALLKPRSLYSWIVRGATLAISAFSTACFWLPVLVKRSKMLQSKAYAEIFQRKFDRFFNRMSLFLILSLLPILSIFSDLEGCSREEVTSNVFATVNFTSDGKDIACREPWYLTWCAILSMLSVSVFLRVHFLIKLFVNGCITAAACYSVFSRTHLYTGPYLEDWLFTPSGVDLTWCVLLIFYLLHLLDRQVEYTGRLDYLWKKKLKKEQEEAATMGLVNKTLLQNILPFHVAQYYLNKESMHLGLDLYHEEYNSVAVMFASIPDYIDFYSETLLNDEGRECLQVLHEIICEFDKLLYESQFLKLEKIKMIGSTFMVAAGLQPGRHSSRTSCESFMPEEDATHNVLSLTRFAMCMIDALHEANQRDSRHRQFHLRIGMALGPVLAGVVGTSKPQYDIWGDTVNTASRMDSTGVTGAIQVTEKVADILKDNSKYDIQCRGQIFIKGKGYMTTYLLYPDESTKL